jgi:hypothetical protein
MSTFNRPRVTELCVRQLAETKSESTILQVWDAGSSEVCPVELYAWGADEVYLARGKNDGQNRTLQFHHFLKHSDEDLIYCVDNDAYHDPAWEARLMAMHQEHGCIVNLFNSANHDNSTINAGEDVTLRRTCGGISFTLTRALLSQNFRQLSKGYDWVVPRWDKHVCTSTQSYVAHVDIGGEHTHFHQQTGQIDTGMNPTDSIKKAKIMLECELLQPSQKARRLK